METPALPATANSVQISLSAEDPSSGKLVCPERRLVLDHENTSVIIGRASRTQSKGYVAANENGWFDSAVMSRKHAEIIARLDDMKVEIKDLGSLHGTYLNDSKVKIPAHETCQLHDGDSIKFGVDVWRGPDNFFPTTVKVGINFYHGPDHPSTTFQVPDGSEDGSDIDEDRSSNEDRSVKESTEPTSTLPGRHIAGVIDLTQSESMETFALGNAAGRALDHTSSHDFIDLSSPPQSPPNLGSEGDYESDPDVFIRPHIPMGEGTDLPLAPISHLSTILFGDNEAQNESTEDFQDGQVSDADNESIRLSTDEDDDNSTDVDAASGLSVGDSESEGSYASESESDVDEPDAAFDDDLEALDDHLGSDVEGSDADDLDEPARDLFARDAADHDLAYPFWILRPEEKALVDSVSGPTPKSPEHFGSGEINTLTPIKAATKTTAPVTIGGLLNDEKADESAPPILQSLFARGHSPSDAIIPKNHSMSATAHTMLVDLGAEASRITVGARKHSSSVHDLCNRDDHVDVLNEPPMVDPITHNSSKPLGNSYCHNPLDTPALAGQNVLEFNTVPGRTGGHWPSPFPETYPHWGPESPETEMTHGPSSKRTHVGISDIVDQPERVTEIAKGKRKAEDISILNEEDEAWAASQDAEVQKIVAPMSPALSIHQSPVDSRDKTDSACDIEYGVVEGAKISDAPALIVSKENLTGTAMGDSERPVKRQRFRDIAERVGYAALGGVTAGAMIVGTLIYTAPTFA